MKFSPLVVPEKVVKNTTSKCPICRKHTPAQVVRKVQNGREQVVMQRTCPEHGHHDTIIASDARFYWHAEGSPENRCGCSGGSCSPVGAGGKAGTLGTNALDESKRGVIEQLSTCIALIEIVDSCNLACPVCFADSPVGHHEADTKYKSFEDITGRTQGVLDRKGPIEVLQFSGGEPTIHPQFFELVRWVRSNPKIDYLLINTNGVLLATDEDFLQKLGNLFKEFDNIQLYLQYDGQQQAGQKELRGADLRKMREKAIKNCERVGIPITLAMTVNFSNIGNLWEAVEFARPYEHIRGISFQPMFMSGRNPLAHTSPSRITMADIILGLHEQSGKLIALEDFTPLPCGDPNCAGIGWLMRMRGTYFSPASFGIDVAALQKSLPDRINYRIEDLVRCGCDNTQLGDLMKKMEAKESNAFRIFIKPFMDEGTWDEDRIDRCCTHVITPDGKLDSFCRYYARKPEMAAA